MELPWPHPKSALPSPHRQNFPGQKYGVLAPERSAPPSICSQKARTQRVASPREGEGHSGCRQQTTAGPGGDVPLPIKQMETLDAEWARDSLVRSKSTFTDSSLRAGRGFRLPLRPLSSGALSPDLGPVRARPGLRYEGRRLSALPTSSLPRAPRASWRRRGPAAGRGALGLHGSSPRCRSEEKPGGGVTSHRPWPACKPGGGRGRKAPRGPGPG